MTAPAIDLLDWQKRCREKGGQPTVDPTSGHDACRLPVAPVPTPAGTAPRVTYRYEPANKSFSDLLHGLMQAGETIEGKVADAAQDASDQFFRGVDRGQDIVDAAGEKVAKAAEAIGIDDGLTGVAGKILGIPHWVVVVVGLAAAAYAFRKVVG